MAKNAEMLDDRYGIKPEMLQKVEITNQGLRPSQGKC